MPIVIVPAALLLELSRPGGKVIADKAWCWTLALYAAAKLAEVADDTLFEALRFTSGYTLKHLLAAAAALCLLRGARRIQLR